MLGKLYIYLVVDIGGSRQCDDPSLINCLFDAVIPP